MDILLHSDNCLAFLHLFHYFYTQYYNQKSLIRKYLGLSIGLGPGSSCHLSRLWFIISQTEKHHKRGLVALTTPWDMKCTATVKLIRKTTSFVLLTQQKRFVLLCFVRSNEQVLQTFGSWKACFLVVKIIKLWTTLAKVLLFPILYGEVEEISLPLGKIQWTSSGRYFYSPFNADLDIRKCFSDPYTKISKTRNIFSHFLHNVHTFLAMMHSCDNTDMHTQLST